MLLNSRVHEINSIKAMVLREYFQNKIFHNIQQKEYHVTLSFPIKEL